MENNFAPIEFYVDSTEKLFHEFHDFLNCNVSTDCVKANTYDLSSFFLSSIWLKAILQKIS